MRPTGEGHVSTLRGVPVDPVFSGLFPELLPQAGGCSCGRRHDSDDATSLPVYRPVPDDVLAEEAARSPVVRQAVALATWLGPGRPVTDRGVLSLADAETAVDELGLDELVLPADDTDADDTDADDTYTDDDYYPDDEDLKPRSAEEMTSLHAVWTAALDGGLIAVRDGTAYPGDGLEVWRDAASPADRLEAWAQLTASYVRAWTKAAAESLLPVTPPLLYAMAHQPIKVGSLTAVLIDPDSDNFTSQLEALPLLADEVGFALEDWAVCGVVTSVPADQPSDGGPRHPAAGLTELAGQLRDQVSSAAVGDDAELRVALETIVDALDRGPHVQLTSLGRYGLARLLAAHGSTVPRPGDCANVEPGRLLDRLQTYLPQDALDESRRWVDARGDEWERALREVASTAAVKDADGPARRTVLAVVLTAAGPRVAPLLAELDADEWLAVPAAAARHRLDLGPELTLAQRLWMVVDGLTLAIDAEEDFESAVHDLRLGDLLRMPDGVRAAAELRHPRGREVLTLSARYLGDADLARQLRGALGADVRRHQGRRATDGARNSRKRHS